MFFKRAIEKLKAGLNKTRNSLRRVRDLLLGRRVDGQLVEQLEEILLSADVGVPTTTTLLDSLKEKARLQKIDDGSQLFEMMKTEIRGMLGEDRAALRFADTPPTIVLVVGVNGTGKTTSIAKLANMLKEEGRKVLLGACDTFRAAANEQLTIWSDRVGVEVIRHQSGADPAAVAFDSASAAQARGSDVLIIDTAGRLHTKANLMKELPKIRSVLSKKIPGAPHETILVLDATTGQNAIAQAKTFKEATDVTGLFLAKLDGTAKGGIVLAIKRELGIPVKFIGIGEKVDDIEVFETQRFVEALFE
ncbi:MAG: signal recognition particle-docking protein FtsY [Planctomycetota bacterium]|nr:signal recognition particle-docking protein FtsY [Planctomycetota bacterium]